MAKMSSVLRSFLVCLIHCVCSPESLMASAVFEKRVRTVWMRGVFANISSNVLGWYFALCEQSEVLGLNQKRLAVVLRFSGHGHTSCWNGSCHS